MRGAKPFAQGRKACGTTVVRLGVDDVFHVEQAGGVNGRTSAYPSVAPSYAGSVIPLPQRVANRRIVP